jgi:hypothetical protein
MRRRWRVALSTLVLAALPSLAAATPADAPLPELRSQAARTREEQLRLAREYKAALERLLEVREADLQRTLDQAARTRDLVDRGLIARKDLDASERATAEARARLDQTWNEAVVAASLIAKTLAWDAATAHRLPPGGEQATASIIRYQGRRPWVLSLTAGLREFFSRTFARPLPISAYGQTAVHDKLGFDHRNAVDVAVHPDSAEGRALMEWLRKSGLSFIAFRGAVAGAATGAHIHVGEPSQRLASD